MENTFTKTTPLSDSKIWDQVKKKRIPVSLDIEITARCNLNCRHCYINRPAKDIKAQGNELSAAQIGDIAEQAVALGGVWCLLTGGEPLLRTDFHDIYIMLKKKGLLVSVYTNACLITEKHIQLFKKYPPREIEVTVYGVSAETYERVTRIPGSYTAFRRGLDMLLKGGIKVRLKAMALRSNVKELPAIAEFCRQHTKDYFRFDPLLHLRFDRDPVRNEEIAAERLGAEEIAELEQADPERSSVLKNSCDHYILPDPESPGCRHLFHCGIGRDSFVVSPEGLFRLCASLYHPDCMADLKTTPLETAWKELVPRVLSMTSSDSKSLAQCQTCRIINLCLWCPAHAHLESGDLEGWSEYFCQVAHARAKALQEETSEP
jgi:radical SAM protein with 4Fe4S-binding SPASM domain